MRINLDSSDVNLECYVNGGKRAISSVDPGDELYDLLVFHPVDDISDGGIFSSGFSFSGPHERPLDPLLLRLCRRFWWITFPMGRFQEAKHSGGHALATKTMLLPLV